MTGQWLSVLLGLVLNLVTVAAVAAWHWPAGNIFVIFWIENVVLGLWTIPKIITARGNGGRMPLTVNGRATTVSSAGAAGFFCLHYSLFCLVHLVFTALIAWKLGVVLDYWYLGLPAVLIIARYSVEAAVTWFGPGHRRDQVTPAAAMLEPYPRIIALQLAAIVCFGLFVAGAGRQADALRSLRELVDPVLRAVSVELTSDPVFAVLLLAVIKTGVDVWLTLKALRRRG